GDPVKIVTVLGTRPEIIRLSRVIAKLDECADHFLVHTGQNYDRRLSRIFFDELGVREPDVHLGIESSDFGEQVGKILTGCHRVFEDHRPDRMLILGDTNSGLAALAARRVGMPVYHMEAGNRCFDDRVPEEVNRRVIDHASTILMPYTERSRQNLLDEGIASSRILVTGNPIKEVIDHHRGQIDASTALDELDVTPQGYFLVTLHRAENVDIPGRLEGFVTSLRDLAGAYEKPVIVSCHPRTRAKMNEFGIGSAGEDVRFLPPFAFFDFLSLETHAFCILSDSGTVQEEACLLSVPNVTLRDVTERPETVECGSNVLAGADPDRIRQLVQMVTTHRRAWTPPPEYLASDVADTVCRILTSFRPPDAAERAWRDRSPS
ncbi:MAG: UDP-N-acetylglucosamine 2-epimerase (non-hydrolyzing), partial [Myxococcota bacterium]